MFIALWYILAALNQLSTRFFNSSAQRQMLYAPCLTEYQDYYILEATSLFTDGKMRFAFFPTSWHFWVMFILNLCSVFKDQPPIQLFLSWINAIGYISDATGDDLHRFHWLSDHHFDDFSNFSQFLWIFILSSSIPEVSSSCLSLQSLILQCFAPSLKSFIPVLKIFDTFSLGSKSVLYAGITVSARLYIPNLLVITTIQIVSALTYAIFCFTHLEWLLHCRMKFDELDMNPPWKNTLLILFLSSKCLRMISLSICSRTF